MFPQFLESKEKCFIYVLQQLDEIKEKSKGYRLHQVQLSKKHLNVQFPQLPTMITVKVPYIITYLLRQLQLDEAAKL